MDTSPDKSNARQFSLRKLMLWMVVIGGYLGLLRLTGMVLVAFCVLTVWMAVVFIARLCWGMRGGMVAVFLTAVAWGCGAGWGNWEFVLLNEGLLMYVCAVWLIAGLCGILAILSLSAVVRLVNWLDTLGRKPTPPDS